MPPIAFAADEAGSQCTGFGSPTARVDIMMWLSSTGNRSAVKSSPLQYLGNQEFIYFKLWLQDKF